MIVIRKVGSSPSTKFNQPRFTTGEFSDFDWDKEMENALKDPVYRKIDPDGWRKVVDSHFGRDAVNRELGAIAKYFPPPKQSIQKKRIKPQAIISRIGVGIKNGKMIVERVNRK